FGKGPVGEVEIVVLEPALRDAVEPGEVRGKAQRLGDAGALIGGKLAQQADPALAGDRAFGNRNFAGNRAQERALARTVAADQPQGFAAERESEIAEEGRTVGRRAGNAVES